MSGISRRNFLGATVAAGAGSALVWADRDRHRAGSAGETFFGPHQAGILHKQAPAVAFLSADFTGDDRTELVDTLRTLTSRAHRLALGGPIEPPGPDRSPDDNGILGPQVASGQVTVTASVGYSMFDERYGLASLMPRGFKSMTAFPGDQLDPARCHGDLGIQVRGSSADEVVHGVRDLVKHTQGAIRVRWSMSGSVGPSRPDGAPRNYLGFKDGISNPDVSDNRVADSLLWVQPGLGPSWAAGGTFQVVRIIRIAVEEWDQVPLEDQQYAIGRFRDSGAPLDGRHQTDIPDYRSDPDGAVIPITAHIRLANPRTSETASSLVLRRGFNYDLGVDPRGQLDQGLVFVCYQQDIARQFEAVQTRLFDEPLSRYATAVGGGYFFALPGLAGPDDFYGRGLLAPRVD